MFGSLIDVPGGALAGRQQLHGPLDILQLLHWDGWILWQQRHTDTHHDEAAAAPEPGAETRASAAETAGWKTLSPPLSLAGALRSRTLTCYNTSGHVALKVTTALQSHWGPDRLRNLKEIEPPFASVSHPSAKGPNHQVMWAEPQKGVTCKACTIVTQQQPASH